MEISKSSEKGNPFPASAKPTPAIKSVNELADKKQRTSTHPYKGKSPAYEDQQSSESDVTNTDDSWQNVGKNGKTTQKRTVSQAGITPKKQREINEATGTLEKAKSFKLASYTRSDPTGDDAPITGEEMEEDNRRNDGENQNRMATDGEEELPESKGASSHPEEGNSEVATRKQTVATIAMDGSGPTVSFPTLSKALSNDAKAAKAFSELLTSTADVTTRIKHCLDLPIPKITTEIVKTVAHRMGKLCQCKTCGTSEGWTFKESDKMFYCNQDEFVDTSSSDEIQNCPGKISPSKLWIGIMTQTDESFEQKMKSSNAFGNQFNTIFKRITKSHNSNMININQIEATNNSSQLKVGSRLFELRKEKNLNNNPIINKLVDILQNSLDFNNNLISKIKQANKAIEKQTAEFNSFKESLELSQPSSMTYAKSVNRKPNAVTLVQNLPQSQQKDAVGKILTTNRDPESNRPLSNRQAPAFRSPKNVYSTIDIRNESLKNEMKDMRWVHFTGLQPRSIREFKAFINSQNGGSDLLKQIKNINFIGSAIDSNTKLTEFLVSDDLTADALTIFLEDLHPDIKRYSENLYSQIRNLLSSEPDADLTLDKRAAHHHMCEKIEQQFSTRLVRDCAQARTMAIYLKYKFQIDPSHQDAFEDEVRSKIAENINKQKKHSQNNQQKQRI